MDLTAVNQTIQTTAWLMAIMELIVGLYLLVQNPYHHTNRHAGAFLLLTAVNSYAVGMLATSRSTGQLELPAILLAMLAASTGPLLMMTTISLLKPGWLDGPLRWIWSPVYLAAFLPSAFVVSDLYFQTNLWYSGIQRAVFSGGFVSFTGFTQGKLSAFVYAGSILSYVLSLTTQIYTGLLRQNTDKNNRRLAWFLLILQCLAGAALLLTIRYALPSAGYLTTFSILAISIGWAALSKVKSLRSGQRGSLQFRLTALVLVIALPVLIAMTVFISYQASILLAANVNQSLSNHSRYLSTAISSWLKENKRSMEKTAVKPDITSMEPPTGAAVVFDAADHLIAHSSTGDAFRVIDLNDVTAIGIVREGKLGPFTYTDQSGNRWRAKADLLPNGWVVIVQILEGKMPGSPIAYQRLSRISLGIATFLIILMAGLMVRQITRPVHELTRAATALAAGDMSPTYLLESDDDIGTLARAFNSMTDKVRVLAEDLERRVGDRTVELERKAVQLQVAAEVAREAAAIRDPNTLLTHTVQRISDRFGFYHAGIFLVDKSHEYAVLVAASSVGGRHMLARKHKLKIGEVGIVGFAAGSGKPRIALDVGRDAVYFNNPDLPETRSEMSLPLISSSEVIGVLDVQSKEPAAFTEDDVSILQVLADQIALAIENSRLFQSSQESLKKLETQYKKQVELAWQHRLEKEEILYSYDRLGVHSGSDRTTVQPELSQNTDREMTLPIQIRGYTIGSVNIHREDELQPWSSDEVETVETILAQAALALENARLQEALRRQAQKEHLASRIAARTQSSLDIDTVMKRAVQEIGEAIKAERVHIQLQLDDDPGSHSNNGGRG